MAKTLYASFLTLITIAAASLVITNSRSAKAEDTAITGEPVLLELFTSQGCSSCPPADRLAARFAREPGLVVISRPVDYWDRLGWKDTFARPENTALQRAYARRGLGGYNGVYTPQIVVAGRHGEVGSDEDAIREYASAASRGERPAIRVRELEGGGFGVGLGGKTSRKAELLLVGVASRPVVDIGRGENGGRRIAYTNVLIDERAIGEWLGGKASHVIAPEQLGVPGVDRYTLVLREPNGGRVLAARWMS
ncbi:MAG: DUF1223 domain-containing protein [Pseudomonadota bacterium]